MRSKMFVLLLPILSSLLTAQEQLAAAECPVTTVDERGEWVGTETIRTGAFPGGMITFRPGGAGFVEDDGALGIKWGWMRGVGVEGRLFIGGRRLDGDAPSARAYIGGYNKITGFQPTSVVFPTPGCWEITGGLAGATVTVVVLVEKIGDGPSSRRTGPGPGKRVTTHWLDPELGSEQG